MDDGTQHEATFLYPKGDPNNPLSEDELLAKFRGNLRGVLDDARAERLAALVGNLENIELADLSACLVKES
jgi:2-methylcitrate dehydratase PrpD